MHTPGDGTNWSCSELQSFYIRFILFNLNDLGSCVDMSIIYSVAYSNLFSGYSS